MIAADPTNPSNKTLKLYGVVGKSAEARYYTGDLPDAFTAEVKVYNGSESQGNWGRGSLSIPGYMPLFNFFPNGLYGANGFLSTCQTEQWYDMKVSYQRQGSNVTTDYWVDGIYKGQQQTDISGWLASGRAADQIALNGGGTAYFDDIRIKAVPPKYLTSTDDVSAFCGLSSAKGAFGLPPLFTPGGLNPLHVDDTVFGNSVETNNGWESTSSWSPATPFSTNEHFKFFDPSETVLGPTKPIGVRNRYNG